MAFRELEYHYDIIQAFEKSESDSIFTELIRSVRFPETGNIYPLAFTNSAATIFEFKRNYDYIIDTLWISAYRGTKQRLWIDDEVAFIYERPVSTTSCTTKIDLGRVLVPKGSYLTLSIIDNDWSGSQMYCYGAAVYGKKFVDDPPLYMEKDVWEDILVEKIVDLETRCPQAVLVTYYIFPYDIILDHMTFLFLYAAAGTIIPFQVGPYCADMYIDDIHMVRFNGYRSLRFNPGDMLIKKSSVLKLRAWHGVSESQYPTNFITIYGRKLL